MIESLNEFFFGKLQWVWILEYATVILIAAAALFLILLITFIAVGASKSKTKKRIKKLQAQLDEQPQTAERQDFAQTDVDAEQLRQEVRAQLYDEIRQQLEPEIRNRVEREYAETPRENNDCSQYQMQAQALAQTVREKDMLIAELNAELSRIAQTSQAAQPQPKQNFAAESNAEITDLTRKNATLQSEIAALKAENARLKAAAERTAPPVSTTERQQTQRPAPVNAAVEKQTAQRQQPSEQVQYADDENEYDNEYGDETSAVKVTLKYDRIRANWVIFRSDTTRAYRRLGTKQDAIVVAKDLARRLHAQLVVHKKDGKFQKV